MSWILDRIVCFFTGHWAYMNNGICIYCDKKIKRQGEDGNSRNRSNTTNKE